MTLICCYASWLYGFILISLLLFSSELWCWYASGCTELIGVPPNCLNPSGCQVFTDAPSMQPSMLPSLSISPSSSPSTVLQQIQTDLSEFFPSLPDCPGNPCYQQMALDWMATDDVSAALVVGAPTTESKRRLLQRFVLSIFYYELDGPNWWDNSLWLTGVTECSWFGIVCGGSNNDIVFNITLGKFQHSINPKLLSIQTVVSFPPMSHKELPPGKYM